MSTCFGCLITDLGSEETLVSKIDTIPDLLVSLGRQEPNLYQCQLANTDGLITLTNFPL